jgi:hypothetical protein
LLIELLALSLVGLTLSLVGLTLSLVAIALVSYQSAGDGTDGTADQGPFGGLIFMVVSDDTPYDRSGESAKNGSGSGVFLAENDGAVDWASQC